MFRVVGGCALGTAVFLLLAGLYCNAWLASKGQPMIHEWVWKHPEDYWWLAVILASMWICALVHRWLEIRRRRR